MVFLVFLFVLSFWLSSLCLNTFVNAISLAVSKALSQFQLTVYWSSNKACLIACKYSWICFTLVCINLGKSRKLCLFSCLIFCLIYTGFKCCDMPIIHCTKTTYYGVINELYQPLIQSNSIVTSGLELWDLSASSLDRSDKSSSASLRESVPSSAPFPCGVP